MLNTLIDVGRLDPDFVYDLYMSNIYGIIFPYIWVMFIITDFSEGIADICFDVWHIYRTFDLSTEHNAVIFDHNFHSVMNAWILLDKSV